MEQNTTNKPLRRVGTLTLGRLPHRGGHALPAGPLPARPAVAGHLAGAAGGGAHPAGVRGTLLLGPARRMPVRLRLGGALPADDGWVLRRLDPYAAGPDAGPRLHHPPVNTRKPVQPPAPKPCGRKIGVKPRRRLWAACKKRRLLLRKKRPSGKTEGRFCMLQVNYALNFSSFSRPSLLATQMLATASPTTFREVTSISMGRLMARMRE